MAIWYRVAWIPPLFDAFNQRFPGRGKSSDGTIGDLAHATGVSGHNPDDTAGVKAERQDADSKPEVRAADVTSALPGVRMYDVVQAMLAGPRSELDRLIYIICDGWQWSKDSNWRREPYYGVDQHWGHAHFSGNPNSDDDGRPWTAILNYGQVEDAYLEDEDEVGASFGPIEIQREGYTSLSIPPVEAGAADPRPAWLNITNDTDDEVVGYRVAIGDGNKGWLVETFTLGSNARYSKSLPKGTALVSISRQALDASGRPVNPTEGGKPNPAAVTPPSKRYLTCCIERGKVIA